MISPKYLLLSAAILGLASIASAAPVYSTATGNYTSGATWQGGGAPIDGVDSAYVINPVTVTIDSAVNPINYGNDGGGTTNIESGGTLTLQNDGSNGDINVTVTPSIGASSSDTTTLTGTLGIELEIDTDNDTVSSLTMINSNIQGTPVSFSGGGFFNPPEYNVSTTTMGVSLMTTTPPGAVNPSTGNYNASEHPFAINQGTMTGSATVLGQTIPFNVNFADTPFGGANSGTGSVTLTFLSSTSNSKTYNVVLIYPVNTTDTLPVNETISIDAVIVGTVKATGTITVPIIPLQTDFEIWLSDNSLEGATFEEDSNQDGLANGLQWALGLTASESPAPHLLTFASSTPSSSTYTITLPAGGSAGDLTISYTPDLTTAFTPLASSAVNVGNPIPAGTTGTVTITLPAGDQGFLKMSAVEP